MSDKKNKHFPQFLGTDMAQCVQECICNLYSVFYCIFAGFSMQISKRHEDIPQVKMSNPNIYKNKSYDMNFTHKNMSYMPL